MSTPKYTNEDMQRLALELAPHINVALNPHRKLPNMGDNTIGFCLCVFEIGVDGEPFAFVANTTREELKTAIADIHAKLNEDNGVRDVIVSQVDNQTKVDPIHPITPGDPS